MRCPFCDAADAELLALYGSQLLTSQYRCRVCRSYFEAVRDELAQEAKAEAEGHMEVHDGRRAER